MSRTDLRIATAQPADEAGIIALWRACELTRPWNDPHADFRLALDGPSSCLLVARSAEGAIAGSVMAGHDGHRGWVYYLAVAPDCRRQGIGRTLMAAAEEWMRERGLPKLQLMVREGNAAADFYARLGYEPQSVVTLGRWLKD